VLDVGGIPVCGQWLNLTVFRPPRTVQCRGSQASAVLYLRPVLSVQGALANGVWALQNLGLAMSETTPPISVVNLKDVRIVEFTNNKILDEANITEIGNTLNTLIAEKPQPKLLLDFANVEYLSSAALGMLISINKRIREKNGQLRLANIQPQIFEVFVITKLNKVFRILPTRDEAAASFGT
jgi:anti-sigma B factor antagonist